MYQILSLRPKTYTKKGKEITRQVDDAHYFERWRFEDIKELYANPKAVLDRNNVPENERWNLFYTVSYCGDAKRFFQYQEIIPFDLDGIDVDRLSEYETVFFDTIPVDKEKTAVVSSGNGLHFIVQTSDKIASRDFFETYRSQYAALCKKLDGALERAKLPGKPDKAIFDHARILRFPETDNKKIDKKTGELKVRRCVVRRSQLLPQPFDLEKVSGLPKYGPRDALTEEQTKRLRTNEGNTAFEECSFLKHVKEDAENLTEPEWYAAASIVARFKNGRDAFHELSKPHPGYRKEETDQKIDQALDNSGPRTCRSINNLWGQCTTCPHYQKISSPILIYSKEVIPSEATGFYSPKVGKDGLPIPGALIPQYDDLLRAFHRDFHYFVDVKSERIMTFNGKKWEHFHELSVHNWLNNVMNPRPKQNIRKEFFALVISENHKTESEVEHFFYESTRGFVNLKNGVMDLSTMQLREHSSEFGFTYVLPFEYDENATAPRFEKFLDEVTMGREEIKKTLLDFMAYCFVPGYTDHCFLWLAGGGRNGKSTFMYVLNMLLGKENVSHVMLDFFEDQTHLETLRHKLLNVSEESDSKRIPGKILGILKTLSGDGSLSVSQKYEKPIILHPYAKFIFASNIKPNLDSVNPAIRARFILVPFDLELQTETENKIDYDIKEKLSAELPGILNILLKRLKGRMRGFRVARNEVSAQELEALLQDSDSVYQWIKERCEFTPNVATTLDNLYADYILFSGDVRGNDEKFRTQKPWFTRKIIDHFNNKVKKIRKTSNGERITLLENLQLKPEQREF